MKFTSIRLVGLNVINFPITTITPSEAYILKAVDGLGPPDVDVTISNALQSEGFYRNSLPSNREIVMRVKLNPDFRLGVTVSDLRTAMYGILEGETSGGVSVQIMNGNEIIALTTAYVKRFETLTFTKDPEVQITLACTGAHFVSPHYDRRTSTNHKVTLVTPGTARAPMIIEARIRRAVPSISVRRYYSNIPDPQERFVLLNVGFEVDDVITIDTTPGKREVILYRGASYRGLIGYVTPESDWPWIDPVFENEISLSGTVAADMVLSELNHLPRYWGV